MLDTVSQAVFVERKKCITCGSADLKEFASGRYSDQPLQGFLAADPWGEDPLPHLKSATWSLVKCQACHQMFHRNILNDEWNERRFSQWMDAKSILEFEKRLGSAFRRSFNAATHHVEHVLRIETLTRGIRGDRPIRLLDFGCGFGSFLEACDHFGFEASGVDRSVGRRTEARISISPSMDAINGQFDAITMFEVLEHLDDPASILKMLFTRLAPGGVLVLETPDCAGLSGISSHRDYLLAHPLEHINCFTNETLKLIAGQAGFHHIDREPVFVMSGLDRALKRAAKFVLKRDGRSTQLYFRKP